MNWRDIHQGTVVYHTCYTHWGKGVVREVVATDSLARMFERGNRRIIVDFAGRTRLATMQLRELRSTPNRKKIRDMVAMYRKRGVAAENGGDRLILPAKKPEAVE